MGEKKRETRERERKGMKGERLGNRTRINQSEYMCQQGGMIALCHTTPHTAYFPVCHAKEYRPDEAREKKWMMRRKKNQYISSALNSIYEVNV